MFIRQNSCRKYVFSRVTKRFEIIDCGENCIRWNDIFEKGESLFYSFEG